MEQPVEAATGDLARGTGKGWACSCSMPIFLLWRTHFGRDSYETRVAGFHGRARIGELAGPGAAGRAGAAGGTWPRRRSSRGTGTVGGDHRRRAGAEADPGAGGAPGP